MVIHIQVTSHCFKLMKARKLQYSSSACAIACQSGKRELLTSLEDCFKSKFPVDISESLIKTLLAFFKGFRLRGIGKFSIIAMKLVKSSSLF